MTVRFMRDHPDGLDGPIRAYKQLRRIYAAAEEVDSADENGRYDTYVVLPTGEAVDLNDANPLNELERYIVRTIMRDIRESPDAAEEG